MMREMYLLCNDKDKKFCYKLNNSFRFYFLNVLKQETIQYFYCLIDLAQPIISSFRC